MRSSLGRLWATNRSPQASYPDDRSQVNATEPGVMAIDTSPYEKKKKKKVWVQILTKYRGGVLTK